MNDTNKISCVKDLKKLIDKCIISGYSYKTNMNSMDFLVELSCGLIIIAKPICYDKEVKYEFLLDTQFLSSKEIKYEEIIMIKNIIEILESNRKFVLKKLKKYTVDEFNEEKRIKEQQSERMLEALKNTFMNTRND